MNVKHALTKKGLSALLLGAIVLASSCKKDDAEVMAPNEMPDSTITASANGEAIMGTVTPTSTSGIIFESLFDKSQNGFNAWDGGDWNGVEAANANSITRSTEQVRGGSHSAKFILNKTDADQAGSKRAELTDWNGRMLNPKSERWYGLSMFLPNSYVADPSEDLVFQWHGDGTTASNDGASMKNPAMAMHTVNGRWQFFMKYGGKFDLGTYDKNVWTDWVLHIKFSPDGANGLVEIWKNGQKVFTRTGKNTYDDKVGNYFKLGIYKWDWKENDISTTTTRVLYHDEVRVGNENSSYAQVAARSSSTAPAPTPEPTPTPTPTPTPNPTPTPSTNSVVFAVNAGGREFKASNGITYSADKNFSGGKTYINNVRIAGTTDDVIYQAERSGNFNYAIPVANGTYEITFRFAEIYFKNARTKRQFDVLVENKEVISNLNIFNSVGYATKHDLVRTVTVTDGILNISTDADSNFAKFSAFHVIKK